MTSRRYLTHRSTEGDGPDDMLDRPAWQAKAACRAVGIAYWFFEPGRRDDTGEKRAATERAKAERIAYCERCPTRVECATQALAEGAGAYGSVRAGVWIGDSRDLRKLSAIVDHTANAEWRAFVEAAG